ncbi:replication-relaxation family protein [Mesobacillus zeae]|uniref:Replication-relaxation n=1 Tax=Mesobacillus zeae TaxID=1917180 RepID=A0A398BFV7_9BACI|nr:replication-relaxation family protein [Mesobacillus zeae]RID88922.1 hypothetical protein D1970_00010 [Mesobacillus zeae]
MKATLAKKQRHESILLSLKKLGYLSRSQIQRLHRLKSDRNANRVLAGMGEYLSSARLGEKIYYLNAAGREQVGCDHPLKRSGQIEHCVMRNDVYIARGCPTTWQAEVKLMVPGEVSVIADALYSMGGVYHIIEVDNTQKMAANRAKMGRYRTLIALGVFEKPPKFIWLTTTEYRRRQLAKLCENLNAYIYTVSDIK